MAVPRPLAVAAAVLLLWSSTPDAQPARTVQADPHAARTAAAQRAHAWPAREQGDLDVRELGSPNPQVDGQFGYAVAGVPDADGDGRGDLLVGAYHEAGAGQSYAGRAYLFSGATGALRHELVSPNPAFGRLFGASVAGVPDADGDGRGDLLVGEPGPAGAGSGFAGRAYLFSGATGALLYELTSRNPETGGLFGIWVSGVEDTDGDGLGDLLVGASHEDVAGLGNAGRAYLFSGATGAFLHELVSPNAETTSFFGKAVSGVPDTDGDGRGDLLVGAFEETVGGDANVGRAYLFSGATGALRRTLLSPDPQSFDYFGRSVSGVSDVDGDGRGDLLVGALDPEVHLFSGATGAHLTALVAPTPGGSLGFGATVSGVPDVDGDGRGDLLVGARTAGDPTGVPNPGRAFVFSGATGVLLHELASLHPEYAGLFGYAVAGVPDADGDGRGDLLVGAPQEDGAGLTDAGRAYLFTAGTTGGCGQDLSATLDDDTPAPGQTITFTVTVINDGASPAPLDLWIDVTGPASLRARLASGTLPPGAAVTRDVRVRVPPGATHGHYDIDLHIGDFAAADVCDTETFLVTVTAAPRLAGSAEGIAFEVAAVEGFFSAPVTAPVTGEGVVAVSPNPFRGQTTIHYAVEEDAAVRLSVHDVLGREVAVLVDARQEAGIHAATFDARGLSAGVYVVRVEAGARVAVRRLTVVR